MNTPRANKFSDWHAQTARALAAGVPLECSPTKARGALLAAANFEDEPIADDLGNSLGARLSVEQVAAINRQTVAANGGV